MEKSRKLPELLAPAGSFDALTAAIEGGADAVYTVFPPTARGLTPRISPPKYSPRPPVSRTPMG